MQTALFRNLLLTLSQSLQVSEIVKHTSVLSLEDLGLNASGAHECTALTMAAPHCSMPI